MFHSILLYFIYKYPVICVEIEVAKLIQISKLYTIIPIKCSHFFAFKANLASWEISHVILMLDWRGHSNIIHHRKLSLVARSRQITIEPYIILKQVQLYTKLFKKIQGAQRKILQL